MTGPPSETNLAEAQRGGLRLRAYFLIGTLLVLLPMIVFSGAMMFMRLEQQRSLNASLLADMAREVTERVNAKLGHVLAAVQTLGASDALRQDDLRAFHALGARLLKTQQWDTLQLMGPAGEHLLDVRVPFGTALAPVYNPEFAKKAAASGTPVLSDLIKEPPSGRAITTLYVPIVRKQEPLKYVIAVSISSDQWRHVIGDEMGRGRGMHTVLLDHRSSIVATTNGQTPDMLPVSFEKRPVSVNVPAGEERSDRAEIASVFGHTSYIVPLPAAFGWTVVSFVPLETFERALRQSTVLMGTGLALFLLAAILLAFWFAHRTTRSISELVDSVLAVADGGAPHPGKHPIREVEEARKALSRTATLLSSRLDNEQRAHAKLEQADHAKNQFLALLGHELRNPLAPIGNAVELLKRAGPGTDGARWATSVIERQSAHLSRLVSDLMDISRIERGKIELRSELLDLRQVLEGVVQDHGSLVEQAGVLVALDVPSAPVMVNGDRVRLAQVVGNLLHNAAKFTPSGGRIAVRLDQQDGKAVVEVSDTGSGIAPENLELVFELFAQERPNGMGVNAGLGLGLALARKLVNLHGGTIRAYSAGSGQGSTLRIELPAVAVAPAADTANALEQQI